MKKGPTTVAAPENWNNDLPVPTVWVDELIHTDAHPQCGDPTCGCAQQEPDLPVHLQMYNALLTRSDELNKQIIKHMR